MQAEVAVRIVKRMCEINADRSNRRIPANTQTNTGTEFGREITERAARVNKCGDRPVAHDHPIELDACFKQMAAADYCSVFVNRAQRFEIVAPDTMIAAGEKAYGNGQFGQFIF